MTLHPPPNDVDEFIHTQIHESIYTCTYGRTDPIASPFSVRLGVVTRSLLTHVNKHIYIQAKRVPQKKTRVYIQAEGPADKLDLRGEPSTIATRGNESPAASRDHACAVRARPSPVRLGKGFEYERRGNRERERECVCVK